MKAIYVQAKSKQSMAKNASL